MRDLFKTSYLNKYKISDWGYTEKLTPQSLSFFLDWIEKGNDRPLTYFDEERVDKRKSVQNFYSNAKSALVFLFSYSDEKLELNEIYRSKKSNGLKIAGYTFGFAGTDYHYFVQETLNKVGNDLKTMSPNLDFRITADLHPVLERDLAQSSGLGEFGKSSMFIHKDHGSHTIIGTILLSQKMPDFSKDRVLNDYCKSCKLCIEACPTSAILNTKTINVSKCMSNYTIEQFKDNVMPPKGHRNTDYIFGCDICQDVCPWNKKVIKSLKNDLDCDVEVDEILVRLNEKQRLIADFFLIRPISEIILDLESMSNRAYRRLFKGTAFERTGRIGVLKNIKNIKL